MPYLAMFMKVKHNSCILPVIQIRSKILFVLPLPMIQLSTMFHENRASSFSVILLTSKQTIPKHNLLAEVIMKRIVGYRPT